MSKTQSKPSIHLAVNNEPIGDMYRKLPLPLQISQLGVFFGWAAFNEMCLDMFGLVS